MRFKSQAQNKKSKPEVTKPWDKDTSKGKKKKI